MLNQIINVPKLRFGEFEGEWVEKRLGNIATFFSGGTPTSTNKDYYIGTIPFIGSGNIKSREVNQFISEKALKNSSSKIVNVGDLLYALYGATSGEIAISKINGAINQAVLCIRSNENISFLYYWLILRKEKILVTYLQGGQGNLSAKIIKNLHVILPQKQEQQKIAAFLTSIDKKIEQLNQKKTLLESYKKGAMQKIFSQEIRFTRDDGGVFEDWEEKRLGDIAIRKTSKNKELKINYVLTNSAVKGIVSQQEYFDKDIANKNNLSGYYIVDIDDFVYNPRISIHAPVGPIKRNKLILGVMSPLYTVFKIKDMNLDFIEQFFATTLWYKYMNS